MKTTIDLDEKKLQRLMRLTGIRTRKEAVDYALTEAEKLAKTREFLSRSIYIDPSGEVIDPRYDLLKLRELEKPPHAAH